MPAQSIEFQAIKKNMAGSNSIRTAFRIPMKNRNNVFLVINGIKYYVIDLSFNGIGISLDDNSLFTIDKVIENCNLHIHDNLFKNLKCKIVQFSKGDLTPLHCGIQLVDLDDITSDKFQKTIRTKLLHK